MINFLKCIYFLIQQLSRKGKTTILGQLPIIVCTINFLSITFLLNVFEYKFSLMINFFKYFISFTEIIRKGKNNDKKSSAYLAMQNKFSLHYIPATCFWKQILSYKMHFFLHKAIIRPGQNNDIGSSAYLFRHNKFSLHYIPATHFWIQILSYDQLFKMHLFLFTAIIRQGRINDVGSSTYLRMHNEFSLHSMPVTRFWTQISSYD